MVGVPAHNHIHALFLLSQERLARTAQESDKQRAAKEALAAKLRAMEGKILKGEQMGGLIEVTRKKEEEIARREQELERR